MRVVCVFGTRPEAFKMAPVIKQLYCYTVRITPHAWVTAQRRQMLDQAFDLFGIQPDPGPGHYPRGTDPLPVATLTLQRLEPHLADERPDWVLVQGDTTTVMATAIVAHHLRINVSHVEV